MFGRDISPNILAIQVQPDEGLHLEFQAKAPDEKVKLSPVDLEFHYDDSFGGQAIPDAYERLLLDALNGDASLFTRRDEIEEVWEIMDRVIQGLALPGAPRPSSYPIGSHGPEAVEIFVAKFWSHWQHRDW